MKLSKRKAYTLIELTIGMAIGLIVLSAMASIFSISLKTYSVNKLRDELNTDLNFALNYMASEIESVDEIEKNGKTINFIRQFKNEEQTINYSNKNLKLFRNSQRVRKDYDGKVGGRVENGHNVICDNVYEFKLDFDGSLVSISLGLKKSNINVKGSTYIYKGKK